MLEYFLQIDRQLQLYLQRVEAVLGKGWEVHVEGQKLKQDGEAFRQKLNTQQLFEDWKKKVKGRVMLFEMACTSVTLTDSGRVKAASSSRKDLQYLQSTNTSCNYTQATGELCPRDYYAGQGSAELEVARVPGPFCDSEPGEPSQPAVPSCRVPLGEHSNVRAHLPEGKSETFPWSKF